MYPVTVLVKILSILRYVNMKLVAVGREDSQERSNWMKVLDLLVALQICRAEENHLIVNSSGQRLLKHRLVSLRMLFFTGHFLPKTLHMYEYTQGSPANLWMQLHVNKLHPNNSELIRKLLQQLSCYSLEGSWFCFCINSQAFVTVF